MRTTIHFLLKRTKTINCNYYLIKDQITIFLVITFFKLNLQKCAKNPVGYSSLKNNLGTILQRLLIMLSRYLIFNQIVKLIIKVEFYNYIVLKIIVYKTRLYYFIIPSPW